MATLPLDLEAILEELRESFDPEQPVAADTRIGHVHLNVADLAASERFYVDGLGLDVTVRTYPGALFVSAGGYHHHLGLNTWGGEGVPSLQSGRLASSGSNSSSPAPRRRWTRWTPPASTFASWVPERPPALTPSQSLI